MESPDVNAAAEAMSVLAIRVRAIADAAAADADEARKASADKKSDANYRLARRADAIAHFLVKNANSAKAIGDLALAEALADFTAETLANHVPFSDPVR